MSASTADNQQTHDASQPARARRLLLPAVTTLWLSVAGLGLLLLCQYGTTPGKAASPPAAWPTSSHLIHNSERPTLLLFAHPRCPCTRASIGELARIMAQCPGRLDARVLFFKPTSFPPDWEQSDLWSLAESIPNVQVACDRDGREAKCFQATTSGHALLYDTDARLLFRGGITVSRGHAGDNLGSSTILSLLTNGTAPRNQTLVFGCPLLGQDVDR